MIPLPGEELVHDHPVTVAVPLDRRLTRDGGPAAAPPAALGRDLFLDRREEPRAPPVSPLDPVRPMAEAAVHLLRHVAAMAPPEPVPSRPPVVPPPLPARAAPAVAAREPAVAPAAPADPAWAPAPASVDLSDPGPGADPAWAPAPASVDLSDSGPGADPAWAPAPASVYLSDPGPGADPVAPPVASRASGLPNDFWRELEADVPIDVVGPDEPPDAAAGEDLAEEILMPPAPPAWRRLLAWAIDGALVLALPLATLALATRGVTDEDGALVPFLELLLARGPVQTGAVVLSTLTAFVYLTLSSALGGRTPGGALAGLGVVVCASGEPPGFGRAALRAILAIAGTFAFLAGPLWALFDGQGRALHDRLAGTVVMADR